MIRMRSLAGLLALYIAGASYAAACETRGGKGITKEASAAVAR